MNYLIEILAFMDRVIVERPSTGQICLWHALMYICNKCGWKKEFTVANSTLQMLTGLSRKGVYDAREALREKGLIDFQPNGTHATIYTLHSACAFGVSESTQATTQVSTQVPSQEDTQAANQESTQPSATLIKPNEAEPNKTKPRTRSASLKASKRRKDTQAYAEYVYLTPNEYDVLYKDYGTEGAARIIEILDSYKGSAGKEYTDDNRAIKNWVIKRWKEEQSSTVSRKASTPGFSPSSYNNSIDFFSEVSK